MPDRITQIWYNIVNKRYRTKEDFIMKKRILATFLSAVTLISCSSALAADYSDVNQSAWYASYVNKISELNAFSGYEDGTFRPDNQITQEEFIKTVFV